MAGITPSVWLPSGSAVNLTGSRSTPSAIGGNLGSSVQTVIPNAPASPTATTNTPHNAGSASTPAPAPTPTSTTGGGGSTSGGGSSTASAYDANAVAYYNDLISQLQTQLGAAQGEQATGVNNIDQAYNKSVNNENESESNALSSLTNQEDENAASRETNINGINQNANGAYNSLESMLGESGAGVSSAATTNVPYAVAKNASGQRAGADTTFNNNKSGIDSATTTAKQQYSNALDDLLSQKTSNEQTFETNLLNSEGSLEQQIGSAQMDRGEYGGMSYAQAAQGAQNTTNAVKSIQDQLSQIFQQYASPTYSVNPVTVTSPNLASYSVDPTTVAASNNNPSTDSSFLPYLTNIQPTQNNILTGGASTPSPTPATS